MKHEAERIRQYFDRVEMSDSFKEALLELEAQPAASPARASRRSFKTQPAFKLVLAGAMCLVVAAAGIKLLWAQPMAGNSAASGSADPASMDAAPPLAVGSEFQAGVDASGGPANGSEHVSGSEPSGFQPGSAPYVGTNFAENGRSFLTWEDPATRKTVRLDITDGLTDGVFDDVYAESNPPVHVVFVLNDDLTYSLTITPASLD